MQPPLTEGVRGGFLRRHSPESCDGVYTLQPGSQAVNLPSPCASLTLSPQVPADHAAIPYSRRPGPSQAHQ